MSTTQQSTEQAENFRAILLMVASMAGFAFTDAIIKMVSDSAGAGQIIIFQGVVGSLVFVFMLLRSGEWFTRKLLLDKMVLWRVCGDLLAIVCIMSSFRFMTLGTISAIMQIQPLFLTIAAILFLREQVSWFRWGAIALGFVGALIIIRPGTDGFNSASLLVLVGVIGLTLRDLCTRVLDSSHSTLVVAAVATLAIIPAGVGLHLVSHSTLDLQPQTVVLLLLSGLTGAISYFAIVLAMRVGEVSTIAPFRYSRLVAAFVFAYVLLGERPDFATLAGSILIVVAGLVVFYRERYKARPAVADPA